MYKKGYVAGVFDLFHIGHLNLINNARCMCEYLTVGVLSDDQVIRFKKKPPFICQEERIKIVASIKGVDEVVLVDENSIDKMDAWNRLHFDCLFSGDDWKNNPSWIRDRERLVEVGSNIHFFEYTASTSSSRIKEILNQHEKQNNNIMIYGAGVFGQRALECYGSSRVSCFIDRDEKKIGTLLKGKPIVSIDKIAQQLDENTTIVVALKNEKEEVVEHLHLITKANIEIFV